MRFRVIAGKHTEGGKTYGKGLEDGNIVETERDLVKLFGNTKFERVSDEEPPEVKAKRERMEKAKSQQTKAGDEDGTPAGATQDPTKAGARDFAGDPLDKDNVHDNVSPSSGLADIQSKLGENVTSEYPKALDGELLVLQKGKNYNVAEKDEPDVAINDKPLTKRNLGGFLSKQLKSGSDAQPNKTKKTRR